MLKKTAFLITFLMILIFTTTSFAVSTYGGYNVPVDIMINGNMIRCVEKPIMIEGTTYIPLRAFSDAVGGSISWDGSSRAAIMTKGGHTFSFYPDKDVCLIDGVERNHASVLYRNLTFIPVRAVSETLGYQVSWDGFYLTVKITAPGVSIPAQCIDYSYNLDDVLYLAKITQIESGSQHFTVKLGVAGTVVNRVKSTEFPNTVKDVIFDTKYGVQFPPAHTDKMNNAPSEECVIAAKCALNGINPAGKSLYFIDTKYRESSWAHKNRPHAATLHDMSFYE